jgi:hypothetical protein
MNWKKLCCALIGHRHNGKVWPIGSSTGKWEDPGNPYGRICYHAYICRRCGKRIPIDAENAIEKEKKRKEIAAVMNASRAQYGLKPLSWED